MNVSYDLNENFLYNHCKEFTRLEQMERERW